MSDTEAHKEEVVLIVKTPKFNVCCQNDESELVFYRAGTTDPNNSENVPLIGLDVCSEDGSVTQTVYFNQWRGYEIIQGLLELVFNTDRSVHLLPAIKAKLNDLYWHHTGLSNATIAPEISNNENEKS